MVPVPATTVPKVDIATGTNRVAPTPAANTPPLTIAAFLIVSIFEILLLKKTLSVRWEVKGLIYYVYIIVKDFFDMFRLALQRRLYSRKPPLENWWAEQLQSHELWVQPRASPFNFWQRFRRRLRLASRPNA